MSIYRPTNINKRLAGTPFSSGIGTQKGSPGNGGFLGPTVTAYQFKGCRDLLLGQRYCGGGFNGGIYKINEAFCARSSNCDVPFVDYGGHYICCGPGTCKWFVAPSCTEAFGVMPTTAASCANTLVGSCGWFVPDLTTLANPGYTCRQYWDSYRNDNYWSTTRTDGYLNYYGGVSFVNGSQFSVPPSNCYWGRAFRYTT